MTVQRRISIVVPMGIQRRTRFVDEASRTLYELNVKLNSPDGLCAALPEAFALEAERCEINLCCAPAGPKLSVHARRSSRRELRNGGGNRRIIKDEAKYTLNLNR
jgi:hypothetical protein